MSTFKSVVTTLGQSRIAAAIAAGTDINITQLAVGDGNGKATTPVATQTKLVKEVYRTPLNSLKLDPTHGNWVIAEAVISASVGGFWMREMGLFADDGALIAVCNMADTYKPTLAEGSGRTQTLRMVISVSNTEAISLLIDDSVIMATEQYVNDLLAAHEKSRNHPDGTLTAKGFVQLNSSVSSTSETLAATPKAVKTANDNANTRVPSTRKINGKQLNADQTLSAADVGAVSNILANVDNATVKKIYDPSIVALTGGVTLAGFFDDHPLGATFQAADTLMTYRRWYDAGAALTQYLHCTSGTIYVRVGVVSKTEPTGWQWRQTDGVLPFGWRKLYDTANPPTAFEVGALPVASAVLGTSNINTFNLAKIGLYVQSTGANATVANGYPAGSQAAGVLEVMPASWTGGVLQRYTVQNTGVVWTRALNASWNGKDGPWRDWVQVSAAGSVAANTALGATDLNTVGFGLSAVQAAVYHQSANASATPDRNYPEAKAGTLFVTGSAYGCQQMYITFDTCNVWMRGLSTNWNGKDGPWRPWVAVYGTNNKPTPEDVGALPVGGTAVATTKLATARKIAGVAFDGTKDIGLNADNVGAFPAKGGTVGSDGVSTPYLAVTGTDWMTKNGNYASGNDYQTNWTRINGRSGSDAKVDVYHYESTGNYHSLDFHVFGGGNEGYFNHRNDGTFFCTGPLIGAAATANGHAVNLAQLNAAAAKRALLAGSTVQTFDVAQATSWGHAVRLDQFQSGSNGNGAWVKLPNGPQWCRQNLSLPANTTTTWTFPAGFSGTPALFISTFNGELKAWFNGASGSGANIYNAGNTALNVNLLAIW